MQEILLQAHVDDTRRSDRETITVCDDALVGLMTIAHCMCLQIRS